MDIFYLFPASAAQPAPQSPVDGIPSLIQAASTAGAPRLEPSGTSAKSPQRRAVGCQRGHSFLSRGLRPVLPAHAPTPAPTAWAGVSGQFGIRGLRNPAAAPSARPRSLSALTVLGRRGCRLHQRKDALPEPQLLFEGLNTPCQNHPRALPHHELTQTPPRPLGTRVPPGHWAG